MSDLFQGVPLTKASPVNRLYYGDNLTIMREHMPSESVDLIYLDPPFNSQRTYNLIYKQLTGLPVPEQEEAFCDAWELDSEKEEMAKRMPITLHEYGVDDDVIAFWSAWIDALRGTQPRLLAYLVYMTYRLFEMRRLLKPTGSIYLHCDPAASHYIKVMMDGVFGHTCFRNEIIWKRTHSHGSSNRYGPVHDVILFYTKSQEYTWTDPRIPHDPEYVNEHFRYVDESGRRFQAITLTGTGTRKGHSGKPWRGIDPTAVGRHWAIPRKVMERLHLSGATVQDRLDALDGARLIYWPDKEGGTPRLKWFADELSGVAIQDTWTDIPPIPARAAERLGYPTQKPLALLDRIIQASSNPGDVVFDPFAGCGTAIYAAHLNDRHWIGCDIAILSVRITRDVLSKRYGLEDGEQYEISGVPLSVEAARDLFDRDPRQFQHWVVELAGGFCNNKHSGDRGVDGRLYFETRAGLKNMVISVKGGHLTPAQIRELAGTLSAQGGESELAGFICLEEPTKGMVQAAARAGMYEYRGEQYPRIQIRTVADLLDHKLFETPSRVQALGWEKQTRLAL